ncbi:hypothetical protein [Pseudonocardia sp.]|uniref:hypothetical protein n=1 Tax=Pseudonocardia sp. TaxID=60912 RepID=UPI0031FD1DBF
MNEQERSAFRAFVREHHPDRGGDPEVFVAGLARFGIAGPVGSEADDDQGDDRYDAPVEVVTPLPFPVRVGVALIRTWHRRHNRRVE